MDILASTSFLPVQLAGNSITHSIDAVDPITHPDRSNLKYQITLLVPEFPQSTTFVPLPTLDGREKPPTTSAGITTYEGAFFEFDAILDGFLALQKPLARQAVISSVATLTMPYKITETIQPLAQAVTRPTKWVMKAALTQADAAGWAAAFFDQYQNTNRQFLTWQPDGKTVGADSEEYLYFLLNLSPLPSQVRLRVELTYADGTVAVQTPLTLDSPVQYQVLCVPVGPKILAQYITAANPLRRYRVWLSNQDNERLTQVRRFLIDPRLRPSLRQILFSNSLGGFDNLRLVGSGAETLRVQRTLAQRNRPADAALDFSKLFLVESTGSRSLTVSTGYFEHNAPKMLRYLDELMLAKEWYLISEKGHLPLVLSSTDLTDADDESDLIARTFTFTVVDEQNAFSDLPAAPATLARPTGWRGVGFMHILDAVGKRTGMGRPVRLEKYFIDDNSLYKPLSQKPNVPGDPHYIAQLPLPGVDKGSTPYPSPAISRPTTYVRSNCPSGQVGGPVLISIPAGKYGGENSGDADQLAEAEYTRYNTQAYADTNGTCTISPELYSYSVPAGQWHYRAGQPSKLAVYRANPSPDMGNTLNLPGGQYTYATNSNDLNFPADGAGSWRVFTYGTALKSYRLRVWADGVLKQDRTFTMNRDGYELHLLLTAGAPTATQKFYLDLQAL